MDKGIEKKELKAEKEKLKQFIEGKHGDQSTSGTTKGGAEEKKDDDKKKEITSSSSASTTSSKGHSRARSYVSSSDSCPPKAQSRKRRAQTRERTHSVKRVRIQKRSKSSKNRRKRANRRRRNSRYRKSHLHNKPKKEKNDGCSEKSDDGCKSTDVGTDDAYNKEYHKKLDALAKYGGNFYCPSIKQKKGLRPIYIDGSNVAYSHGQNEQFSVEGLKICIDYFRKRGHKVKAFVPHFRLRKGETTDHHLLHQLVNKKLVITTPTLYIQNQRRSPYDDWYIIQSAAANGGIIVSADNFQDIMKWNPNLRSVIEECRLVPTFVDDMLIFPVDPHGNRQNNLEQFLRF